MKETHWTNCYGKPWGALCAEGMAKHPAKYSRALIYKIVAHMVAAGYIARGDTVLDPFGGVALGAIPLIERGIHWAGVELESHFVALAQANIDKWNDTYRGRVQNWGRATIYWGDSRYLLPRVASAFGAVMGSPPYGNSVHKDDYEAGVHKFARSSGREQDDAALDALRASGYGTTLGQLGEMGAGDFDAVMSSPPYAQSLHQRGHGIDVDQCARERDRGRCLPAIDTVGAGYGAVVSSPPYADNVAGDDPQKRGGLYRDPKRANDVNLIAKDGDSDGQLGHVTGDTFWAASKLIVSACYDLLRPDSVAVWVVKNYARNWKLVPFAERWLDLQLSCGFTHIETIVAHQVDDKGVVQQGLFGDDKALERRHGGLFRRIYEKRGGPVIACEYVLILKKPLA